MSYKKRNASLFYYWEKRYDYDIFVVKQRGTINEEKGRKGKSKIAEYDQQCC